MPDAYAHEYFGQQVRRNLDSGLEKIIDAHKNEFETGLLGPDIFFFYQPYRKNAVTEYGRKTHRKAAIDLFEKVIPEVKSNASHAYLLGLICHYALDSHCHPYVYAHCHTAPEHMRMESAFDTHLMLKSGIPPRRKTTKSGHDYTQMAVLWPEMSAEIVRKSVQSRRKCMWLFNHRGLIELGEAISGRTGEFTCILLPESILPEQEEHMAALEALFEKALFACPGMIEQIENKLRGKTANMRCFQNNYRGEFVVSET